MTPAASTSLPPRHVHPWVFMALIIPFGAASGYVTVTLAYQLKQAGASVAQIAALSALGVLPQTWKFLWAPVVDITLNQKRWYIIAGILCAIGTGMTGFFPATKTGLTALSTLFFFTSVATTFLAMAVESLLAYSTPEESKGHVAGWYQAGNLGGGGIGGGLGLYLVGCLPAPWMASSIVGGLCLLCCVPLFLVPTPERPPRHPAVLKNIAAMLQDLWELMRNRSGILAFILCFLPIGTSAVGFSAIADEWKASSHTVALINGVLGGVICAVGCILGGWMCDRMNRQRAYVVFGVLQAASGVAMALFPRTQAEFVVWVSVYMFTAGLSYAAFSAFVLEVIGKGAAATKYNALASLSNVPIYYMTNIDGWAHDRWNSAAMFYTESGLAVISAVVFMILAKILLPRRIASL
ncbi:MAG TPA: MFS transporter [Verrucomicrobiae bacterium]|nr:MFS transporter [Verrucomicrobiae bacterium]